LLLRPLRFSAQQIQKRKICCAFCLVSSDIQLFFPLAAGQNTETQKHRRRRAETQKQQNTTSSARNTKTQNPQNRVRGRGETMGPSRFCKRLPTPSFVRQCKTNTVCLAEIADFLKSAHISADKHAFCITPNARLGRELQTVRYHKFEKKCTFIPQMMTV
jgi:hypothetical protein